MIEHAIKKNIVNTKIFIIVINNNKIQAGNPKNIFISTLQIAELVDSSSRHSQQLLSAN